MVFSLSEKRPCAIITVAMGKNDTREPLVSVTLPLAADANPALLEICSRSLSAQTYRNFEVLILVSEGSPPELLRIAWAFPSVRVFEGSFTKSAARNFLANRARGEYMLYIDVDIELSPGLLEECVAMALEHGSQAVIAPAREAPSQSFWARCRSLEKQLLLGDSGAESPLFLDLSAFNQVGGFDERLDLLDDWALTLRLRAKDVPLDRVQSPIFIRETTSLVEMFLRKYQRGQFIPALVKEFPDAPQVRFTSRFANAYLRKWRLLVRSPIPTLGLAFLKILDMVALSWGRLHPLRDVSEGGAQAYFQPEVARAYDEVRLGDNFNRYKHYAEIRSLVPLLRQPSGTLLEVGCGTGRITHELVRRGFRILPMDPSPAMLGQFVTKPALPHPVRADGTALPFKEDCFEGTYALRVIWHLLSSYHVKQVVREMRRVASRFVILDIANEQRWRHPLIRPVASVFFALRPRDRRAHRTSQLLTLDGFSLLAQESGLRLERFIPLDVLSPIWLNLLPSGVARAIFPILRRLELILWKVVPPGRFLVTLKGTSVHENSL